MRLNCRTNTSTSNDDQNDTDPEADDTGHAIMKSRIYHLNGLEVKCSKSVFSHFPIKDFKDK